MLTQSNSASSHSEVTDTGPAIPLETTIKQGKNIGCYSFGALDNRQFRTVREKTHKVSPTSAQLSGPLYRDGVQAS